jgi:hypothetical protein
MQMDAQIARLRGVSRRTRAARMRNRQSVPGWFKIRLLFSLAAGGAWGLELGVILVRINAQRTPLYVIAVALPTAFAGSMLIGLLFNGLGRPWHKVARLLAMLIATAVGLPFGLAFGLSEQQLDAVQLFNATGALTWNVEWLTAMLGLTAGIWPGWTTPLLYWLGCGPRFGLELLARFFETMGRAFLWAPLKIVRAIAQTFQELGRLRPPHIELPHFRMPRFEPPAALPRETSPRSKRRRLLKPKSAKQTQANHGDGPRVMAVVEDRCPYCLDVIKRKDPRGVRTCDVCGTPHHADCWSITGKCQVPHLNT